jgi:hypothetical protein
MLFPVCGFIALGTMFKSARKKHLGCVLGLIALLGVLGLAGCGGGSSSSTGGSGGTPGTTAGNYTVTVTGIAGALTNTTSPLNFTVQ